MKMMSICRWLVTVIVLMSINNVKVESIEFEVGGDKGWVIPSPNNSTFYNDWASKNRFNVNDTLRFEYKKDSVLVVEKEDYEKCKSSHPLFFSNNGDTIFELDRAGLFYFISGVSGHCERDLKMIIKVLEPENAHHVDNHTTSAAPIARINPSSFATFVMMIIISFFGTLLIL